MSETQHNQAPKNKNWLKQLILYAGIPLTLIGILANFSDAIQLIPEGKREKLLEVFTSEPAPLFKKSNTDTLLVLVTNLSDIAIPNNKNSCFGKALTSLIERTSIEENFPILVKFIDEEVLTENDALTLSNKNNADLIFWGKIRNVSSNCLTDRIEIKAATTLKSGTLDKGFLKIIERENISGYDVEDGFQFIDEAFIYIWLHHFVSIKRANISPDLIAVPTNLPDSIRINWHVFKAEKLLNSLSGKKTTAAIKEYEAILGIAPKNEIALSELPYLHLTLSDSTRAFDLYKKATVSNPKNSESFYQYAIALYRSKRYEEALINVKKAISIDNTQSYYYILCGHILDSDQQDEEALKYYSAAIDLTKDHYGYYSRANFLYYSDKDQAALADINKALSFQKSKKGLKLKGWILYALKDYEEAKSTFSKAISLDKNDASLYNARGLCYARLGLTVQELNDYDSAIKIDSSSSTYFYNRGLLYGRIEMYELALRDQNKAIYLNPEYKAALSEKTQLHIRLQEYDLAINTANEWAEIDSTSNYLLNLRGIALTRQGKPAAAIIDFRNAALLDTIEKEVAYNNISYALANLSDYEQAKTYIDSAFAELDTISTNPYHYKNRGVARLGLGHYCEAKKDFTTAIDLGIVDVPYFHDKIYKYRSKARFRCGDIFGAYHDFCKTKSLFAKILIYLATALIPLLLLYYTWKLFRKKKKSSE